MIFFYETILFKYGVIKKSLGNIFNFYRETFFKS